jgi:lipopolysaccharide transport system permease protein
MRELVWSWTSRTIRGRYQQSALGWLWAIVQPAASAAIFTFIFTRFVPIHTGDTPYVVFSYIAMVPWTFLATSLNDMTSSMIQNMNLVKKIYFPREAILVATMLARLLDAGVASGLLIVLMLYFQVPLFSIVWLYLPVILATQIMLILGLGLICATLNVFYRDIQSLVALGIQIWFYASPIIYPVSTVPEHLRTFFYLNPMTGILEAYRDVLLNGQLPGSYFTSSILISTIICMGGYWFFKHMEVRFADII